MPLVSVVTATYNRAHLLGETISSVLDQSFSDFEYIIVDDGSEDNTEALIAKFADPRLRYFRLPHTGRLSSLRNYGHTKCVGELIAYVDSDDLWVPTKLEKQVAALQDHPAAGFSFTDIELFDERGIIRSGLYGKQGTEQHNVFAPMLNNELVICHTTLIVRQSALKRIGDSDEAFRTGDHDLVFRLSREVDAVIHYEPLVRVRRHTQNTSRQNNYQRIAFEEHHRSLKKLLESGKISIHECTKAEQLTSYSFGSQSLDFHDYDSAIHYFKKSLARNHWHAKSWAKLCLALAKKIR